MIMVIPCTKTLKHAQRDTASIHYTTSTMATISSTSFAPTDFSPTATDTTIEVKITLLSLTGVVTKNKKHVAKSKRLVWKNRSPTTTSNGRTSLVASLSQNLSTASSSTMTHVPSFPIDVSHPRPIVRWQSHLGQVLSTLRFPLQLQHCEDAAVAGDDDNAEDVAYSSNLTKGKSFIPRTCSINISLSRNGKLATLGKAHIVISGDETSESIITVPVVASCNKTLLRNKESISMKRIKGDNLQLGLQSDATLCVLVSVANDVKGGDTQDNSLSYNVATNDLSYEHFLDFIIGAKSAEDIRSQSNLDVSGLTIDAIEMGKEGKEAPLLVLNDTMTMSVDGSDSDEMVVMQHEMFFEDDVHVLSERRGCDTKETCAHGCPVFPEGNVIHAFLNVFSAGYNGASHGEDRFVVAIQATKEAYPEVWTNSKKLELVVSILIVNGTDNILDENLKDARINVAYACFFEQWIYFLQNEAKTSAERAMIAELLNAGERTVVNFLRKRIPCTCLNGKRQDQIPQESLRWNESSPSKVAQSIVF